jgi:hypothetical protein
MNMNVHDCSDVRPAALLAELVNSTAPLRMGFFAAQQSPQQMTEEDAAEELASSLRVDYVRGLPIKTDFSDMTAVSSRLYDRDAGEGAFLAALERVRRNQGTQAADYTLSAAELQQVAVASKLQVVAEPGPSRAPQGSRPCDHDLQKFQKVWFVDAFVAELRAGGMPYPSDWFMYMGTQEKQASFVGSMGGRFAIADTAPVIARVE